MTSLLFPFSSAALAGLLYVGSAGAAGLLAALTTGPYGR